MTLSAQYTLGSPNDHWGNRDGKSEVKLLSLDKVDDAAVIYEQDTLKIHCFLILQCHQAVRTLFITLADCNKRKSWEKLKGGRAAKWQVKSWKEERRAMSPDPPAEYQGLKAPSSTISAEWRRVLESRVHLSPICRQVSIKITLWRMFASQLFVPFFTNITQLRPVHDGIDALIPRLQTQAGSSQAVLKSPSNHLWTGHIHTTVLLRHRIGHIISQIFFAQCSV